MYRVISINYASA